MKVNLSMSKRSDVVRHLQSITAASENVSESSSRGYVGIWWLYMGELIDHVDDLDEARTESQHYKVSVKDHSQQWQSMVIRKHPELRQVKYTQLPRGRVVYNTKTHTFELWGNPDLLTNSIFRKKLEHDFMIDNKRTEVIVDRDVVSHYTGAQGPNDSVYKFEKELFIEKHK